MKDEFTGTSCSAFVLYVWVPFMAGNERIFALRQYSSIKLLCD